jgi:threonine/homoserine/homoserine lactone efflux protein
MAFRTACFILAVTVAHGWLQWVMLAGAVFLPYMGVLLANQANETGLRKPGQESAPEDARQLTAGPEPEYVEGVVIAEDDDERYAGTARA